MEILVAVAFVAGILTILTPCIAPVVPLVLGAASTGGRRRSVGIVVGFGLSFLTVTVLLASLLAGAGLTTDGLRAASAALLVLVGLMVAVPRVAERVGERLSPVAGTGTRLAGMRPGDGLPGGLLLGAAIGLVWAPCVGPIMAGVIAAAAVRGPGLETLLIASAYLVGAAIPLALLAGWAGRADVLARRSRVRRSLGVAMAISALLVLTGRDLALEEGLAAVVPAGLGDAIAGVERQPAIGDGLDALRAAPSRRMGRPRRGSRRRGSRRRPRIRRRPRCRRPSQPRSRTRSPSRTSARRRSSRGSRPGSARIRSRWRRSEAGSSWSSSGPSPASTASTCSRT
jgi:cytochrome c-type biogenesis protein